MVPPEDTEERMISLSRGAEDCEDEDGGGDVKALRRFETEVCEVGERGLDAPYGEL